jgi:2-succinyl-6-hydroxy-2,4-cyclohexadiene-1-carboxylate synthase
VQPGDDRYDLEALVDDLGRVIDEFGGRKVFLTGLSMGAATALSYALSHPERLAGLLVAAYPHPGERLRSWALEFAATIEREGIGRAGAVYVWGESSSFEPSSTSLIRRGFLEHSEVSLTRLLRDCLARLAPIETIATRLSGLRVPTRIVAGSDDVGSIEPSQALARLIPNSCLSVLDGAGHVVNLERVSAFNEELRRLIF